MLRRSTGRNNNKCAETEIWTCNGGEGVDRSAATLKMEAVISTKFRVTVCKASGRQSSGHSRQAYRGCDWNGWSHANTAELQKCARREDAKQI